MSKYKEPEVSEAYLEQIADQVAEGYTTGLIDDGQYRITYEIKITKFCTYCNGTGEAPADERDNDGNWQRGVGSQKCICQLQEPSDDMDDDS